MAPRGWHAIRSCQVRDHWHFVWTIYSSCSRTDVNRNDDHSWDMEWTVNHFGEGSECQARQIWDLRCLHARAVPARHSCDPHACLTSVYPLAMFLAVSFSFTAGFSFTVEKPKGLVSYVHARRMRLCRIYRHDLGCIYILQRASATYTLQQRRR